MTITATKSATLTYEETWSECIRMWYDCCYHKDYKDLDIVKAKHKWLGDNGYNPMDLASYCFFCTFIVTIDPNGGGCNICPGKDVDPHFWCCHPAYSYDVNRIAFYNKIAQLNAIRLKNNQRICLAKPIRSLKIALQYIVPRRLTLKSNPRVHAWLWWNF